MIKSKTIVVQRSAVMGDRIVSRRNRGASMDSVEAVMFFRAFPLRSRVKYRVTAKLDVEGKYLVAARGYYSYARLSDVATAREKPQCWIPKEWDGQRISLKFREIK